MNTRGSDLTPIDGKSKYYSIYFVLLIIIGAFFITNLFVGVVVSTYTREKEKLGSRFMLT
jgi:hypothetical protein